MPQNFFKIANFLAEYDNLVSFFISEVLTQLTHNILRPLRTIIAFICEILL